MARLIGATTPLVEELSILFLRFGGYMVAAGREEEFLTFNPFLEIPLGISTMSQSVSIEDFQSFS